jgi:hypothetical protein
MLAALALAAAPSVAVADVEIPLDTAVSGQYQAAEAVVEEVAEEAAAPVAEPETVVAEVVPAAAPAAEPEAPRYQPDPAPQYHVKESPSNSDFVSQAGAAEAPAEAAPREPPAAEKQPADEARAPAREAEPAADDEPAHVAEKVAAMVESVTGAADATAALPPVEVPAADLPAEAPVVPSSSGAAGDNVNVSIRIFSPGDDGPVTQVVNGGGGQTAPAASAPTTWIWNWNWNGGAGCDPGSGGNRAPPLGVPGWMWIWNWTCGEGKLGMPDVGAIAETLPEIASGEGILEGIETLPSLEGLPGLELPLPPLEDLDVLGHERASSSPAESRESRADDPAARAERTRPVTTLPTPAGGPPTQVQASPILAAAPAATPRKPVVERRRGRDITDSRGAIPTFLGMVGPPVATSAAGAASAASGGAPALLTPLVIVFASFVAGWLLVGVGLPRLKPRSSRLERPG